MSRSKTTSSTQAQDSASGAYTRSGVPAAPKPKRKPRLKKPSLGTPREQLLKFTEHACHDGQEFARQFNSMAEVWEASPRIDWLQWMLDRTIVKPAESEFRLFAVWCIHNTPITGNRTVWDLLTDPRSKLAVVAAEKYAKGQITDDELDAAGAAAGDAAGDAARDAARALHVAEFRRRIPNPFLRGCMIGQLGGGL